MFKIARESGEISQFRSPITNFAPGMSRLEYMDNKPKTNYWFLSYHTYQQTLSDDIPPIPISQGTKGFFKVEITPDTVNQIFFQSLSELYQAVYFMDTPESDKFLTTEKELGTEPELYLRLYSTSSSPPTVLKSQNIGGSSYYENSEFLTSILAVAMNRPLSEEIDFYDESLTKKGQIKTSQVSGKVNYVKSISEVPSVKRLITLGGQGVIDVWDLSNLSSVTNLHSFRLGTESRKIYIKALGLVEENTVLLRSAGFGKNFQNKFLRIDYTKDQPGIVSKASEFNVDDATFTPPKNVIGTIDGLYGMDDA